MEVWARLGRTLDTWCWAGASRGPACPHGPLSRWTLSPPPWAFRLLPLRVTFSRLLQSAPGARDTWCARDIRAPCCQLLCSFTRSFCFFLSPFLLFSFSFFFLWLPCSTWSPGPGIGSEWWFWPKLQPWPHGIPSPLWWLRIEHASHCSQDIADPLCHSGHAYSFISYSRCPETLMAQALPRLSQVGTTLVPSAWLVLSG